MPHRRISSVESDAYILAAAERLRQGGIVVFPTETVYGVGANATDPAAIERLRELKGRPATPFTVHIGRPQDAADYVSRPSPLLRRFSRRGWPGPLTLIATEVEASEAAIVQRHPTVLAGAFDGSTVGLRCPDHPAAQQLLLSAGVPVVASSANRAGDSPPTTLEDARAGLGSSVDGYVPGGATRYQKASTIVRVRGNGYELIREGTIEPRVLERWATSEVMFVCTGNSCRSPMAEYLFRVRLGEALGMSTDALAQAGYRVSSSGTGALGGAPISSGARAQLARAGIDAGAHSASALTVDRVRRCDRVYAMSPDHLAAVEAMGGGARAELLDPSGPIADPIGGGDAAYNEAFEQIDRAVRRRVEEFVDEDRHW